MNYFMIYKIFVWFNMLFLIVELIWKLELFLLILVVFLGGGVILFLVFFLLLNVMKFDLLFKKKIYENNVLNIVCDK